MSSSEWYRKFYRQSSEVLDRAKVAKILLNVNKGINVSSTTDIVIDENEELGENENNENNLNDNGNSSDQDLEEELISMRFDWLCYSICDLIKFIYASYPRT